MRALVLVDGFFTSSAGVCLVQTSWTVTMPQVPVLKTWCQRIFDSTKLAVFLGLKDILNYDHATSSCFETTISTCFWFYKISCVPRAQTCSIVWVSNDLGTKTTKGTVELLHLTEKRPALENWLTLLPLTSRRCWCSIEITSFGAHSQQIQFLASHRCPMTTADHGT
jgi:hypothetical protein